MSGFVTALGVALLSAILVGYFGIKHLPPPKPSFIGIDLGTTFSCIGAFNPGYGNVSIFENEMKDKCIPSAVFFNHSNIIVGKIALENSEKYPLAVVYDAKRFIGKQFTQESLDVLKKRYAFGLELTSENGVVLIAENVNGSIHKLTPEMIGSYIIAELRRYAENAVGRPLTKGVVSVPADFDASQRNHTKKAAALAGVDIWRFINEPTAAAMAYGLHNKTGVQMVTVVDFGGGTLDVSLLQRQGRTFYTAAIAGNNFLGGQDFNHCLYEHISLLYLKQYSDISANISQKLKSAIEVAKIAISSQESAIIQLENFRFILTVDFFNTLCSPLFEKLLEPIRLVLVDASMSPEEIDGVVLVGGSTRIPKVQSIISNFFNMTVSMDIDPELAVVTGASIQAGTVGNTWPLRVSAIDIPLGVRKIHVL